MITKVTFLHMPFRSYRFQLRMTLHMFRQRLGGAGGSGGGNTPNVVEAIDMHAREERQDND